jgi:DNA-binding transcriptional regulator YiaG
LLQNFLTPDCVNKTLACQRIVERVCWSLLNLCFQQETSMKVKDQIKARREQLGMSIDELARRLEVSGQAVRHWESGRSFPGKSKAGALEAALSITLDWTEGSRPAASGNAMAALVNHADIDLLLLICQLPPQAKQLVGDLVRMHLTALEGGRKAFTEKVTHTGVASFTEKNDTSAGEISNEKPIGGSVKAPRKRAATRRKAA